MDGWVLDRSLPLSGPQFHTLYHEGVDPICSRHIWFSCPHRPGCWVTFTLPSLSRLHPWAPALALALPAPPSPAVPAPAGRAASSPASPLPQQRMLRYYLFQGRRYVWIETQQAFCQVR